LTWRQKGRRFYVISGLARRKPSRDTAYGGSPRPGTLTAARLKSPPHSMTEMLAISAPEGEPRLFLRIRLLIA
jgi:hypothetical protein